MAEVEEMKTSDAGIKFLGQHEGCKLTAYQDTRGIWTIGYGHTPSKEGETITQEQAEALLSLDVRSVERCIAVHCRAILTQPMFDALVSLVYNIGCGHFRDSTLLAMLNRGDYTGAADQFLAWSRAGSNPFALSPRRKDERFLFLSGFQNKPSEL
jgi:lysozyme